jgi:hypothetical protein
MDFLIAFLSRILTWLVSFVQWIGDLAISTALGALITLLNAIPVPSWMSSAPSVLAGVPSGIVWLFQILQLPAGLVILLSAWVLRFLIRRIPLIG